MGNQDENCHCKEEFNRKTSLLSIKTNIEQKLVMFGIWLRDLDTKKIRAEVFGEL